jgi:ATP-binding cassette, subfamily B, bacterial CvaB/MchF/RaxB
VIDVIGNKRIPVILQAESAECGLACLAMVSSCYGHHSDIFSLRQKFGSSARGADLKTLISHAEALDFSARAIRIDIAELEKLTLPAILHWNFNHFVVLKKLQGNNVVCARNYTLEELGKRFTGIALELSPRTTFTPKRKVIGLSLWEFFRNAKGLYSSLIQLAVLSILIQVIALATPLYLQLVVDEVLTGSDQNLLTVLAVGFAGLTLLAVAMTYIRGLSSIYLTSQLRFNIGQSILHHLIRLPLGFYSKRHLGDVLSRFESLTPIQGFISTSCITIVVDGLLAITTVVMMFWYSTVLGSIVILSAVLYGVFRSIQFEPLKSRNLESINASANLESHFIETIRSIQSIKLAGKETPRESAWKNKNMEAIGFSARANKLTVGYEAANSLVVGMEMVLVVFLGAKLVLDGIFTIGMLYAFLAYRANFSKSAVSLIDQAFEYKMIGLHLERLSDITSTPQENGLQTLSSFSFPIKSEIALEEVTFSYDDVSGPIFSDFSIALDVNQFTAINGPSGIGKSTLLKVLMGLYLPTQGRVLVDGLALNSGLIQNYRKNISAITQEDSLLSGSIIDNISFFDLERDLERIIEAATLAEIHEDIIKLPMQYDSLIGDMGTALSQGQLQRILLARAIYSKPQLLFLDEGTAFLDQQTEEKVFNNIKTLGIGCIFVTHNNNLMKFADRTVGWGHEPGLISH